MGADFNYSILIQVVALVASAVGVYAAIKSSLAVIVADLINLKDDHRELKDDFKSHVRNGHVHRRSTDV